MKAPLRLRLPVASFIAELDQTRLDRAPTNGNQLQATLQAVFMELGGRVETAQESDTIEVVWTPEQDLDAALEMVVSWLKANRYRDAILVFECLLRAFPADPIILYNLGMSYSDTGHLERARLLLEQLTDGLPADAAAHTALGMVYFRQGNIDEAVVQFREALQLDPNYVVALRNLGGLYLKTGETVEARQLLEAAVALTPADARSWWGLGQAAKKLGDSSRADAAYLKVIKAEGFGELAELAKQARTRLALSSLRLAGGGELRLDAVMYCLSALDAFAQMTPDQVRDVGFEIALLGRQGLDVNNPNQHYSLKSLPGERTGLELVAIMYVAFQQVLPGTDVGFDLAREYQAAVSLRVADNPLPL